MSDQHKTKMDTFEARLAASEARVAELEAKLAEARKPPAPTFKPEPHERFDPTARATMPPSALRDLVAAVPDRLMADLRSDALKPNPVTQSVAQLSQDRGSPDRGGVQIRGSGWREPNPLSPPPGVAICDQLVDQQDRVDRVDLERRLARSVKKE
jgi:hypothetical protein